MKTKMMFLIGFLLVLAFACAPKKTEPATPAAKTVNQDTLKKVITARLYLKPQKINDFLKSVPSLIDSSSAEPGNESYNLYQSPFDKTQFIFVEVWKNQEAIDHHFSMSYFKAFGTNSKDWFTKPSEVKIFSVTSTQ